MRKVLIVTYYWPPAGGPGVQRVLKFVKYLPQFGWQPVVFTIENGEYPAIDSGLVKEVPDNLKVYYSKSFSPFKLYKRIMGIKGNIPTHVLSRGKDDSILQKLFRWIRVNIYVPDGRRDWIKVIAREGEKVVRVEKPDLIFSTAPPHSVSVGTMKLARKVGIPWIADFRDPWTDGYWLKSLPRMNFAKRKDLRLELAVLKTASALVTITNTWVDMFQAKVPNNYYAIPNGYDHEDFENSIPVRNDKFKIVYTGSLRENQIPWQFLRELSVLYKKGKINNAELHFFGTVHKDAISYLEELSMNNIVVYHGYVDHEVVISNLINAQILLMLIPDTEDNEGILPGKIFEYLGSKNYILGIGPRNGEAEKLINNYGIGHMRQFNESTQALIIERYNQWINGVELKPQIDIKEYSRLALTKHLVSVFNKHL